MYKYYKIVLILCLLAFTIIKGQVTISLPDTSKIPNKNIKIPIYTTDLTGKNVYSYQFRLKYDKSILKPKALIDDETISDRRSWDISAYIDNQGLVVNARGFYSLSGKGVLLYIKFDIVGDEGQTDLKLDPFTFNNGKPAVQIVNGSFRVYVEKTISFVSTGAGEGNISVDGTVFTLPFEEKLEQGKTYEIEAIPNNESEFSNWGGDVNSSENPLSYKVEKDSDITVNFSVKKYIIKFSKSGEGSGEVSIDDERFNLPFEKKLILGKTYKIEAHPNDGSVFDIWEGNINSSVNPYFLKVSGDANIQAKFSFKLFTISFDETGEGSGKISINDEKYNLPIEKKLRQGVTYKIGAHPNEGSLFEKWSGEVAFNYTPFSFKVVKNAIINAEFSLKTYVVSASINPEQAGIVEGLGIYRFGELATLTAKAYTGNEFIGWSVDGQLVSSDSVYQFQVQNDTELMASFNNVVYQISANSNPSEAGSITGSGFYFLNQTAVLTAYSGNNWIFENWTDNDTIVSFDSILTFSVVEDKDLMANYKLVTDIAGENSVNSNFISSPYPNPFNPSTAFQFGLKSKSRVSLKIYDISGKIVDVIHESEIMSKGLHFKYFTANNLSSGIYFYQFISNDLISGEVLQKSGKLILMK